MKRGKDEMNMDLMMDLAAEKAKSQPTMGPQYLQAFAALYAARYPPEVNIQDYTITHRPEPNEGPRTDE